MVHILKERFPRLFRQSFCERQMFSFKVAFESSRVLPLSCASQYYSLSPSKIRHIFQVWEPTLLNSDFLWIHSPSMPSHHLQRKKTCQRQQPLFLLLAFLCPCPFTTFLSEYLLSSHPGVHVPSWTGSKCTFIAGPVCLQCLLPPPSRMFRTSYL